MALTPEDVVNKRFSQTKFREGYDQDEVDDFLDEVVVELRRLTQENEELKAQLEAGGSAPAAAATPAPAVVEEAPAPVAEVPAPVAAAPAAPAPAAEVDDESVSTTNLLQLARRLHDEHVKEGAEKRDALIAEGHATAARIVAEAETKQRNELARLNQEKAGIEHRIDELRTFEKDYRAGLKSYIEEQLKDLTSSGVDNEKSPTSSFSGFGG
ncbi:DivIVA domain-containing protein [Herbiconiux liangxiaofengii]|uniref:DivIVA domain-containing protein n=1 Tax=Herbiconiux liangxiaofengii TaxID=3342795 RepID=UPI0035B8A28B